MKNIIDATSIKKHNIKKYNFKVLSTPVNKRDEKIESEVKDFEKEQAFSPAEEDSDIVASECPKEIKDDFIAELLEKSDKMSSELIKLQMQIEEGQKEFEVRLAKEREAALQEGEKIGYERAKAELESKLEEAKEQYIISMEKLDNIYEECKRKLNDLIEEMSNVAIEISKEIVAKEVSKDSREIAYALSKKLLDDVKGAIKIELKVNPKDYEYIKEKFSGEENIKIGSDKAISEGGVIIMSDIGNIDGDLKTRFEKVKQLIMVGDEHKR